MKVLFVAGFGPIVGDVSASRRLYGESLGVRFKEERRGIPPTPSRWKAQDLCALASRAGRAILLRPRDFA